MDNNKTNTLSEGVVNQTSEIVEMVEEDGVLKTYPSFTEIVSNPKYKFNLLSSQMELMMFDSFSSKWEIVVRGVNKMCNEMYGIPFYKSYLFQPTKDPYDYDKSINIEGVGLVYDSRGVTHEVDYDTFLKLTLVMYLSFMGIQLTEEQYDSSFKFRSSSTTVYRILD